MSDSPGLCRKHRLWSKYVKCWTLTVNTSSLADTVLCKYVGHRIPSAYFDIAW